MTDFDDPLALFRAAAAAIRAEDWRGAADCCDPASLRAFARQTRESFAPAHEAPPLTVEQLLRDVPDLPRAVAEYQVAQHRRYSGHAARLRHDFPGVASVEALLALDDAAVFAAYVEGRSLRRQLERLVADGRADPSILAEPITVPSDYYDFVPVGWLPDGERLAHVLFHHGNGTPPEQWTGESARWFAERTPEEQALTRDLTGRGHPFVATCRRQPDGTWRLLADHGFQNLMAGQIAAVGRSPD